MSSFKKKYAFQDRCEESYKVSNKFIDRIPIICEKSSTQTRLPDIDKHKYLVPKDLTLGQFMYVIRKRMNLKAEEAIFLFVSDTIPPSSSIISDIYNKHKDHDGFLYMQYGKENVFG
jgi:GABA(A) receptor-associated protein